MESSEKEMDFMGVWVGLKRKKRLWLKWRLIDAVVGLVGAFSLSKGYGATTIVVPNLSVAMLRRALFEKQGGLSSDYLVLADWDFWLKTTLECDFYYLREPLNNFRQHQTTIRASIKTKRQVEEVFRMYYNFFRLSAMGFGASFRWRYHVGSVWAGYFWQGKKAWLCSLPSLLGRAFRYDPLLPLLAISNFIVYGTKIAFFGVWSRKK